MKFVAGIILLIALMIGATAYVQVLNTAPRSADGLRLKGDAQ